MFAFCRYIKANVARFDRKVVVNPPHAGTKVEPKAANKPPACDQNYSFSNIRNTYANVVKAASDESKGDTKVVNDDCEESNSVIELQTDGTKEFPLAMEGDENSQFFHVTLKKKRRQISIKVIQKNGEWIVEPDRSKDEFMNHFQTRFQVPTGFPSTYVADMINCLSPDQVAFLERTISNDEIKRAVSEQSAFIKGRNILDGPLVLNEVMAWHRSRKKQLMIFKVDFEKAFDSLKWDFLDLVLEKLGLHAFICKAINVGLYKGISIGNNLRVSYLMYTDDIIFIVMDNVIGCRAAKFPFNYLGVPIGCNMSRCSNWDPVIKKISTRLSHWKALLLSIRGRLTLIKSVLGSLPLYFMSLYKVSIFVCNKLESMRNQFFLGSDLGEKKMTWVSWKKCLSIKKLGGLGIGSIYGLNVGLLFKWIWRFLQNAPDLWVKIIKFIYGQQGGIFDGVMHRSSLSPWFGILSSINSLKLKGIDLLANQVLRRIPRGGSEAAQLADLKCRGNHRSDI
ncbi:hypothetical protein Tco_0183626, partial [Tanacetum coccineum]